jgi:hypothetical protein
LPAAKDLAEDISDAKLKVTILDIEVVEMINRLNILQVELGLPIEDLAQSILANVRLIVIIFFPRILHNFYRAESTFTAKPLKER